MASDPVITDAAREAAEAFFPPALWKQQAIDDVAQAFATFAAAAVAEAQAPILAQLADNERCIAELVATAETLASHCRKELTEREATIAKLREILTFDCTAFPAMEEAAIRWANTIAGPRGKPPMIPDPVMILEMCEDVAKAAIGEFTP